MTKPMLMAMDRAAASSDRLAFDRASVRSYDRDGRLHVEMTNISKANVCPYLGSEIPDGEALGLDPSRIYYLLRDPQELEKAASTFNTLPLTLVHQASTAEEHPRSVVIGTTGADATFESPYLRNGLVVWDGQGIELIETKRQQELSCGYHYRADMTPGTYEGVKFDGVMRDIHGNHVTLVETGRAGPDIVVGDQQLEFTQMSKKAPTRKAVLAKGALMAVLKPILATDAKLDIGVLLDGVTNANWKAKKPGIISAIKPKLATDADIADVVQLLDGLDGDEPEPMDDNVAIDVDPIEKAMALLRDGLTEEEFKAVEAKMKGDKPAEPAAADAPPAFEGKPDDPDGNKPEGVSKPAMDAAIKAASAKAAADAEQAAITRIRAIGEAEKIVRPYVGELAIAQDSAEAVYKTALDTLGVKTEGIHPSALRAVLEAQPKPSEQRARIAVDQAIPSDGFAKRFPDAARIRTV